MQDLEAGDIILFGSYDSSREKGKYKFMVDTVFVIGEIIKVDSSNKMNFENHKLFKNMVSKNCFFSVIEKIFKGNSGSLGKANSSGNSNTNVGQSYTLYRGATTDSRINGMFSFFPCKQVNENHNDAVFHKVELDTNVFSIAEITQGCTYRLNVTRNKKDIKYEEILENFLKEENSNLSKQEKIKLYWEALVSAVFNSKDEDDNLLNLSLGVWAEEPNFFSEK